MERRRYPRIHLPLLVELKHPTLGAHRCVARDLSEGGIFVYTDKPQVKPGAKVKVTVQNTLSVESQPTPTVEMEVKRIDEEGLALAFVNATGRHLWESVEQLRTDLAIGRDLFQIHLNAIVIGDGNAILLVQQHGKWTFPATFLNVGEDWRPALERFLHDELGITATEVGSIVAMNSLSHAEVPEAAVLDLFVAARADACECKLAGSSRYKTARWTDRRREVEESTFATDQIRDLAVATLKQLVTEEPRA